MTAPGYSSASVTQSAEPSAPPDERRRHLRFPFSATAEVREIKSGVRVTGRTSDLGLGGCYVDCISPCPLGAAVRVRIEREQEKLEATGSVVYSQIGMGMGVMFDSPPHPVLEKWIRELNGEAPAELQRSEAPLPRDSSDAGVPDAPANDEQFFVLNELVITLMRKKVLSAAEGKSLLSKLHRESSL
jgi:PilZ domain